MGLSGGRGFDRFRLVVVVATETCRPREPTVFAGKPATAEIISFFRLKSSYMLISTGNEVIRRGVGFPEKTIRFFVFQEQLGFVPEVVKAKSTSEVARRSHDARGSTIRIEIHLGLSRIVW